MVSCEIVLAYLCEVMDMNENARFFQNRQCEYFPCHPGVPEHEFNCLFCFCPLYALGKACGGQFHYSEHAHKLCSDCTFPHRKENYDAILARYEEISDVVRRMDREDL